MRTWAIALVSALAEPSLGCHPQEPKALPPVQIADITAPRSVLDALALGTLEGVKVLSRNDDGTESVRFTVEATDHALGEMVKRGCTGERYCTVRIHVPKETVDARRRAGE